MCRAKGFRRSDQEAAPSPSPDRERILYLDILRGIALFGILVINLQDFEGPLARSENPVVQSIIDIFVQGKFITLFSFLFGIGFAIQMSRAGQKGLRFLSFYPRRLASLALFGLIHGIVIWSGDILLTYAIIGALLLLFRNQSQKALLYWAGAVVALQLLSLSVMQLRAATDESESAPIAAHRTIVQLLNDNWHSWVSRFEYVIFALPLLSVFLIGLWVWRTGAVEHLADYRPVLKRICAVCLPLGLALNTASEVLLTVRPDAVSTEWFADVLGVTFAPILSAGYASGIALLIQRDGWQRRFTPFAAVGRMALTNYLMQSVVCTTFFYLTGLYGKLGPAWDVLFAVVLYSLQIVYSNWWLARHRYGPMEWLWRRMTYGSPNLMP